MKQRGKSFLLWFVFTYGYLIDPAPFVGKMMLSLLNYFDINAVKNQLTLNRCVYFQTLYYFPLIYVIYKGREVQLIFDF